MRFLSLFENTKTSDTDLDAIILLSKNITEFVKENKISSELKKINTMPYPKNTISFFPLKSVNLIVLLCWSKDEKSETLSPTFSIFISINFS